jgi:hypothetical protein
VWTDRQLPFDSIIDGDAEILRVTCMPFATRHVGFATLARLELDAHKLLLIRVEVLRLTGLGMVCVPIGKPLLQLPSLRETGLLGCAAPPSMCMYVSDAHILGFSIEFTARSETPWGWLVCLLAAY